MFARCLRTVTSSSKTAFVSQQQQLLHVPAAIGNEGGGMGERESESESKATLSCQWLPWVYGYELSIIVQEPFTKMHRSSHSLALACVFVVTLGALLLALVSLVALCLTGGDTDAGEGAQACFGASRAADRCRYESRNSGSSGSSSGSSCSSGSMTPFVGNESSGRSSQSVGRYPRGGGAAVGVGVVSGSSQVVCKGEKVI
jgi:hypothetical protein